MNKTKAATIAGSIGLVFFVLTWLISRPGSAGQQNSSRPDAVSGASKPLPQDPVEQKKFLEDYLRDHPGSVPALLRLGQLARTAGQLPEARRFLEQALASDPALIEARLQLADVCTELVDYAAAESQYQQILERDPRQVGALSSLGSLLARQGRTEDAARYWREALRYGPNTESGRAAAEGLSKLGH